MLSSDGRRTVQVQAHLSLLSLFTMETKHKFSVVLQMFYSLLLLLFNFGEFGVVYILTLLSLVQNVKNILNDSLSDICAVLLKNIFSLCEDKRELKRWLWSAY